VGYAYEKVWFKGGYKIIILGKSRIRFCDWFRVLLIRVEYFKFSGRRQKYKIMGFAFYKK
jgi:hypothetical protein